MDNVNICFQLEGLGLHVLVSDYGIVSAIKIIGNDEITYEVKEYSNKEKIMIDLSLNNTYIFKAVNDNLHAFTINYALSLYHLKHHISILKEKHYESSKRGVRRSQPNH